MNPPAHRSIFRVFGSVVKAIGVGTVYDPLVSATIPPSGWWCMTGILPVYQNHVFHILIDGSEIFSNMQCFILIGFFALFHSVADFITGVRYFYCAAILASRLVTFTDFSFSRCARATSVCFVTATSERWGASAWSNYISRDLHSTSKSLRLPGCSAPRSIQRPTQLCSPSSSSPSHSLASAIS